MTEDKPKKKRKAGPKRTWKADGNVEEACEKDASKSRRQGGKEEVLPGDGVLAEKRKSNKRKIAHDCPGDDLPLAADEPVAPKEPEGEDVRKQRLSRKSAAYHRARKAALERGDDETLAKVKGREVMA